MKTKRITNKIDPVKNIKLCAPRHRIHCQIKGLSQAVDLKMVCGHHIF